MTKPLRKTNMIIKIMNSTLIDLPSPSNITYWWNMGSLLGLCLMLQVITGIILSFHYSPNTEYSFSTMSHITRDVNTMWLIRIIHANGASLFFLLVYIHIVRGIFFTSYINHQMWFTGVLLILMLMGTAFMGYVLPWGQMSFWAATVITNLLSAIPYIGPMLVQWMWGGFSVDNPTLTRFFSFHFILPFIIMLFSVIHIMFLHMKGSSNPLGLSNNIDKSPFHPYFTTKDIIGLMITATIFTTITLYNPFFLGDPENYNPANPMITPIHIQPEWYFLFAYAILRSIPNKLGGVIALMLSILILLKLPYSKHMYKTNNMSPINKMMLWVFISVFLILTWLGSQPIEHPFNSLSQIFSFVYFLFFMIYPMK